MIRVIQIPFQTLFILVAGSCVDADVYHEVSYYKLMDSTAPYNEIHGLPFVGNADICTAAANKVNVEFDSEADIEAAQQYSVYEGEYVLEDEVYVIHAITCGIIPRGDIFMIFVRKTGQGRNGGIYHVYYDEKLDSRQTVSMFQTETQSVSMQEQSPSHTWGSYLNTSNDSVAQQSPTHSWGSYIRTEDLAGNVDGSENSTGSTNRTGSGGSVDQSSSHSWGSYD